MGSFVTSVSVFPETFPVVVLSMPFSPSERRWIEPNQYASKLLSPASVSKGISFSSKVVSSVASSPSPISTTLFAVSTVVGSAGLPSTVAEQTFPPPSVSIEPSIATRLPGLGVTVLLSKRVWMVAPLLRVTFWPLTVTSKRERSPTTSQITTPSTTMPPTPMPICMGEKGIPDLRPAGLA